MRQIILIWVFFLALSSSYISLFAQPNIIGGDTVTTGEFQFVAGLIKKDSSLESNFCGGTLIHKKWILTAAHCVDPVFLNLLDIKGIDIHLKSYRLKNPVPYTYRGPVKKIVLHPGYNINAKGYAENDLALLELEQDPLVQPVIMPSIDDELLDSNIPVTTLGWGNTSSGNQERNSTLMKVDLGLLQFDDCSGKYYKSELPPNTICAAGLQGGSGSTAPGDSGGPLLYKRENGWMIYAVTSGGSQDASIPGFFSKVIPHLDWIKHVISTSTATKDPSKEIAAWVYDQRLYISNEKLFDKSIRVECIHLDGRVISSKLYELTTSLNIELPEFAFPYLIRIQDKNHQFSLIKQ